mgnify:CR=1 FL=1
MSRDVVMYLNTGPSHLANQAVSAHSLRRYWSGEVLIAAWPQSRDIALKIARDRRIDASTVVQEVAYQRKNAQEIAKISLIQKMTNYDRVVYLDADTIINKPLDPLFNAIDASPTGFAATQFGAWAMPQGIPRKRVECLRGIPGIPEDLVEMALLPGRPSYNSGIFACRPTSPVLPVWGEWTTLSKHIYISGETALHLVARKFEIVTMPNGVWNCSPMFQSRTLPDADVGIWHFHGDCNVRPRKSQRGLNLWWPEFELARKLNIGGIAEWADQIGNEYLNELILNHKQTV